MPESNNLKKPFRRVVYNTMLLMNARIHLSYTNEPFEFNDNELTKIAMITLIRNLDEFLFSTKPKRFTDDLRASDFQLQQWQPDAEKRLNDDFLKRINKIIEHPTTADVPVFNKHNELYWAANNICEMAIEFINACIAEKKAKMTSSTEKYIMISNDYAGGTDKFKIIF